MNQQFVSAAHSSSFQLILAHGINYKHFACLSLAIEIKIYEIDVCNLIWFSSVVILNNSASTHTDVAIKNEKTFISAQMSDNLRGFRKINVMCSSYVVVRKIWWEYKARRCGFVGKTLVLLNENRRDLLKERKCLHGFKINRMINAIENEQLNFKGRVFKFELLILNLF